MMKLEINETCYISDITEADQSAYIEHFKEKQIYDQTANIPFPYTMNDAAWWVKHVAGNTKAHGRSTDWAIRRKDGCLIGGIGLGLQGFKLGVSHSAEIGYWLAKPYWNQGIVTGAVKKVCEMAFQELGLVRITAHILSFNTGSARVLEKAGFQLEGILRKHYKKDGKLFDGKLYAKLRE